MGYKLIIGHNGTNEIKSAAFLLETVRDNPLPCLLSFQRIPPIPCQLHIKECFIFTPHHY